MLPNTGSDNFDFDSLYHVYTQVNGNELIFREQRNYLFFLDKVKLYLLPVLDIYAYCLLPSRFHLLIAFKNRKEILQRSDIETVDFDETKIHQFLMKSFSNMLNSYAKAYNKVYGRKGSLFVDYLKRLRIDDETSLLSTFREIHNFPVKYGCTKDFSQWKYSSYHSYLKTNQFSLVKRDFLLAYFESQNDFIEFHKKNQ